MFDKVTQYVRFMYSFDISYLQISHTSAFMACKCDNDPQIIRTYENLVGL